MGGDFLAVVPSIIFTPVHGDLHGYVVPSLLDESRKPFFFPSLVIASNRFDSHRVSLREIRDRETTYHVRRIANRIHCRVCSESLKENV